jgi:predicted 2-oxoglutarate/Fe(II)-dependent dioxygenase YbiX
MNTISNKVSKSYGLHENMKINITDLFVVKYKDDAQNQLEMHCDGSFLSFNILLSDKNDFEGGGTYFDDGLTAHLEQGDIFIHSSKIKHAGLPITKGTRYLLVGFLNIIVDIEVDN